ncbi:hypothetical protein NQ156_00115 [Microbacterium sp. zg.Y625]|uniref:hypothetical protein n=1 Tax=Microbacterium jiangjiandongii TaxID=3049071 RepID=UPI00214C58FA|nr:MULTISPECIES: hypothetical protein [unclassified Microbacterium]MCR2791465.1 hypothetical protein [Microbacterium sp. zg.Y625]WIM24301.1 hypothetical protein QNO14_09035 [Microbacterium sp. zg-Y625]
MTTAQATTFFDTTTLVEPIDRKAVRKYGRDPSTGDRVAWGCGTVTLVMLVTPFLLAFLAGGIALTVFLAEAAGPRAAVPVGGMLGLWVLLMTAGMVSSALRTRTENERAYRLRRFAAANGMEYRRTGAVTDKPGMLFPRVRSRYAQDVVSDDRGRVMEIGNIRCEGRALIGRTRRWGYLALRLDTPLPHIVLDAVGNNSLGDSSLPVGFKAAQRLSLEGDFDRAFRLYCPAGYERDALYLFTPDIMARFIDNAAELDVEIVDDWMFLYRRADLATLDPATWEWLGSVHAAMTGKLAQWERWRDGRVATADDDAIPLLRPPRGVAVPGQRLRRTLPWATILLAAASIVTVYQAFSAT